MRETAAMNRNPETTTVAMTRRDRNLVAAEVVS